MASPVSPPGTPTHPTGVNPPRYSPPSPHSGMFTRAGSDGSRIAHLKTITEPIKPNKKYWGEQTATGRAGERSRRGGAPVTAWFGSGLRRGTAGHEAEGKSGCAAEKNHSHAATPRKPLPPMELKKSETWESPRRREGAGRDSVPAGSSHSSWPRRRARLRTPARLRRRVMGGCVLPHTEILFLSSCEHPQRCPEHTARFGGAASAGRAPGVERGTVAATAPQQSGHAHVWVLCLKQASLLLPY